MNEDRSRSDRPVRPLTETDETRDHWYDRVLTRLGLKSRESIRHDLEDALAETVEDTDFSPQERAMLKNVLSFHRIRVEDVMVPRADIVAVAADTQPGRAVEPVPHRRPFPPAGLRRDPRRSQGHGPYPGLPRLHRHARRQRHAGSRIGRRDAAAEPRPDRSVDDPVLRQYPAPGPLRAALHAGHRPSGAHAGDAHPHGPRDRRIWRHRRPRLHRGPGRDGGGRHRGRARRGFDPDRSCRPPTAPISPMPAPASTRSRKCSASTLPTRKAPRISTRSAASSSRSPAACRPAAR